ncbi:MAG: hypothetical protein JRG80_09080 [Deltaproteobacteria bacterium]|nr:hypothetical protein [Deltaproteobacteria bacterium]
MGILSRAGGCRTVQIAGCDDMKRRTRRVAAEPVAPSLLSSRQVAAEFRQRLADGAELRAVGDVRDHPERLLDGGYTPKHRIDLFDATFYLTNMRLDDNFRFFVAYVLLASGQGRRPKRPVIHPRIFYKDSSLVWRSPTHSIRSDEDNWIGKGDMKWMVVNGEEIEYSAEETTNLPLEMQAALDLVSRRSRAQRDRRAIEWVLRSAPDGRFEPYRDFSGPRAKAMADPHRRINGGRDIAVFERENDPTSLRFVAGFEPDFDCGVIAVSDSGSNLYGGAVKKFRILSKNRKIQYQFIAGPRQVWIIPPQPLTTELMSYGVRTVDANAPEDLCVPGYEYHFIDESEDPPVLYSQIPEGFVGAVSEVDPARSDASPWIEQMPVIREFRKKLGIRRAR